MELPPRHKAALEVFRRGGGMLRTTEILRAGVHRRELYALRDAGLIDRVSRGVYRLTDLPPFAEPDLVVVASRVPKAVFCLVTALHFHDLGSEIPREVSIALPRGTATPKVGNRPLHVYRFSPAAYEAGVERHLREGVTLSVYGAAKTVADCFKFRNQLGIDVAVEALRGGLEDRKFRPADVMRFARICRVDRIVRPYLEALQ